LEKLSVYKVDDTWAQYGYYELYTSWGGKSTGEKMIVKNGELVRTVSSSYVLLPNEVVREVIDSLAAEFGATKVTESEDGWKLYILYDFQEEYTVDDASIRLGFYIQNSVDGKLSLAANVQNLVMDPKKGSARIMFPARMTAISPTRVIGVYKKRHKVGELERDVEAIKKEISSLIVRSRESIPLYKFWKTVVLDKDDVDYLVKHIPAVYLPQYIKAMSKGITLGEVVSLWDVIIDIAKALWTGDCSLHRKYQLYRALLSVSEANLHRMAK